MKYRHILGFMFLTVALLSGASAECVDVGPAEVPRNIVVYVEYSGKPLKVPLLLVDATNKKVMREVITDASGKAEFHDLAPGLYLITTPVALETSLKVVARNDTQALRIPAIVNGTPVQLNAIRGIITDISGAVIPHAVVVIEQVDRWRTPVAAAKTDDSGRITISVPTGVYELKAASPGFQTAVVPVQVTEKGWSGFRLLMQVGGCPAPSPSFKIQEDTAGRD